MRSVDSSEAPDSSEVGDVQETLEQLLGRAPRNWHKWGGDDEIGALNYLTPQSVLAALQVPRQGKVFTLQVPMARPGGDPVWPGRSSAQHFMVNDKSHYLAGNGPLLPGGAQYADDFMTCFLQGSTQYDALGHVWLGDHIWNGYPAMDTVGGLRRASVLPIANRGVVGRALLLDLARYRQKDSLSVGETFTHQDLRDCAAHQGTSIEPRDILLIRTGWLGRYYRIGSAEFYADFREPGLQYSPELVRWFAEMEIPNLVTDTMGNEVTVDPDTGFMLSLHVALMHYLGVVFTEIAWLDDLAADCESDGQYTCLYVAAPLKVVEATGAPVNPLVLK